MYKKGIQPAAPLPGHPETAATAADPDNDSDSSDADTPVVSTSRSAFAALASSSDDDSSKDDGSESSDSSDAETKATATSVAAAAAVKPQAAPSRATASSSKTKKRGAKAATGARGGSGVPDVDRALELLRLDESAAFGSDDATASRNRLLLVDVRSLNSDSEWRRVFGKPDDAKRAGMFANNVGRGRHAPPARKYGCVSRDGE